MFLYLETQSIADKAAEKVEITYTECKKPIITIEDAINAKSFFTDETVNCTYGDTDSKNFLLCIGYICVFL